ncbi:hypothetical protein E2C01_056645 [Portunus trituberculatus]|uniref:Uncharacterized protein n=1 Tax=Portunus trituberculatus TaxID=210409 RepID=A0A5B7GY92_PORTR|nr:hypothetical protein [Portunus trituberculatus]
MFSIATQEPQVNILPVKCQQSLNTLHFPRQPEGESCAAEETPYSHPPSRNPNAQPPHRLATHGLTAGNKRAGIGSNTFFPPSLQVSHGKGKRVREGRGGI